MKAGIYIGAVATAGALALGLSLRQVIQAEYGAGILAWAALTLITLAAGRFTVKLPFLACRVSISDALIFLTVLAFGAPLATLTGALDGYVTSSRRRGNWYKRLFNTAGMAISVHLSARLFGLAVGGGGSVWSNQGIDAGRLTLAALFLGASQYVLNTALVGGVVTLAEKIPFTTVFRNSLRWTGAAYLAGAGFAAIVCLVAREAGLVSLFAILPFPALLYVAYVTAIGRSRDKKLRVSG